MTPLPVSLRTPLGPVSESGTLWVLGLVHIVLVVQQQAPARQAAARSQLHSKRRC